MDDADVRLPRVFWLGIALILAGLLVISLVARAEAVSPSPAWALLLGGPAPLRAARRARLRGAGVSPKFGESWNVP